jgi:hypothetical protein
MNAYAETVPPAGPARMDTHLTIVAALHIAFGLLGTLGAFIILVFVGLPGLFTGDVAIAGMTMAVAVVIGGMVGAASLAGVIGGIGLLRRAEWARLVILVVSVIQLINIPFGTILGGYSMWVLLSQETRALLRPAM